MTADTNMKLSRSALPSAGALVMMSWNLYIRNFRSLIRVSVLMFLATPFMAADFLVPSSNPLIVFALGAAAAGSFIVVGAIVRPALICQIDSNLSRRSLARAQCLTKARRVFWPYLLVTTVLGLIIAAGYAAWILPGVVLTVFLAFTEQAVVLEHQSGTAPFRRSFDLTVGHFLPLLWRFAVVSFIFGLAAFAVSVTIVRLPIWLIAGILPLPWQLLYASAMTLAIATFTTPLFLTTQGILFVELKKLQKRA